MYDRINAEFGELMSEKEGIKGYPSKLKIYKRENTAHYQVKLFANGKEVRRTTGTSKKQDAIEFAKKFYDEITYKERNNLPVSDRVLFTNVALECVEQIKREYAIRERIHLLYRETI